MGTKRTNDSVLAEVGNDLERLQISRLGAQVLWSYNALRRR